MRYEQDERTLSELFADLSRDARILVRQEVALAKIEMKEKATAVGKNVGLMVAGGAVAYAGFLVILAALVASMATFLPLWLAALIVGAIVTLSGALLIQQGKSGLEEEDLTPKQTVQSLKENKEWAQEQLR
jgi:predicted phage tail protein